MCGEGNRERKRENLSHTVIISQKKLHDFL